MKIKELSGIFVIHHLLIIRPVILFKFFKITDNYIYVIIIYYKNFENLIKYMYMKWK